MKILSLVIVNSKIPRYLSAIGLLLSSRCPVQSSRDTLTSNQHQFCPLGRRHHASLGSAMLHHPQRQTQVTCHTGGGWVGGARQRWVQIGSNEAFFIELVLLVGVVGLWWLTKYSTPNGSVLCSRMFKLFLCDWVKRLGARWRCAQARCPLACGPAALCLGHDGE